MTPTASNQRAPDRVPLDIPLLPWLVMYYSASDRTFWPIYGPGAGYLLKSQYSAQNPHGNHSFDG